MILCLCGCGLEFPRTDAGRQLYQEHWDYLQWRDHPAFYKDVLSSALCDLKEDES